MDNNNGKWTWLTDNLYKQAATIGVAKKTGMEQDDVVQETLMYLFQQKGSNGQSLSDEIYLNKNVRLLTKILKKIINQENGSNFFDVASDFSRYKKIHSVCEKYNIPEDPRNAFKIHAILNEKQLSISLIEQILYKKKPLKVSFDEIIKKKGSLTVKTFL